MKFLRVSDLTDWVLHTESAGWANFCTVLTLLYSIDIIVLEHYTGSGAAFKILSNAHMLKNKKYLLITFVT